MRLEVNSTMTHQLAADQAYLRIFIGILFTSSAFLTSGQEFAAPAHGV